MKILISLSYYIPNVSGLTIYAKNLGQELSKRGHIVKIISSKHKKELLSYEKENKVEIERIPISFKIGKGPIMLTFPYRAFSLVKKYDIINCHLPQFESFIIVVLAKFFHKKVILTYHTGLAWEGSIGNKGIKIVLLFAHAISAMLADVIVSYTDDYASKSLFLKFFKHKIVYILPPIPQPKENKKTTERIKQKIGRKTKYKIGIAARLAPEKGFEYVFHAVPLLREKFGETFIILVAGPKNPIGEREYYQKIMPIIKEYKDDILFLGSLSSEEMGSFYSLIDVLLLPSVNMTETFGLVQVEAMLCGTPVITSNLPGVRIPVQKTGMGKIITKKNKKELVSAIEEVLKNKKAFLKPRKTIRSLFSLEHVIDEYEKLFVTNE